MERRKLTKEDIDKVRNIEGFPIGTDEDIIALSDAPFYTACPNPFIEDFIKNMSISPRQTDVPSATVWVIRRSLPPALQMCAAPTIMRNGCS